MKTTKKQFILVTLLLAIIMIAIPQSIEAAPKVQLNKKKITMVVGEQRTLKVKNTTKSIKWSSSKKRIAKVDKKGVVIAKKQGTATITAKVGKQKFNCKVTVKDSPALEKKAVICVGRKMQLKVTGTAKKITWKSENRKIVKVNKKGWITGVSQGIAKITAMAGNKKLICKVKVKEAVNEITAELSVSNTGILGIEYWSDEIYCESLNPDIATAKIVEPEKITNYKSEAAIIVYGHKSGSARFLISNNCNEEKDILTVEVIKPENSAKQRLIDYILLNGESDDAGDKFLSQKYNGDTQTAVICFDAFEQELMYEFAQTDGNTKVNGYIFTTENENTQMYITMYIYADGKEEGEFVTTVIDAATYAGENLTFEEAWYGITAQDAMQKIANAASQNAFKNISALLKEKIGITWKDIGFLKL